MTQTNRQILIDQLPTGKLSPEHFRLCEAPVPAPAEGEVLVRVLYVAVDAAARAWMLGPTYRAALTAGQVMAGLSLAQVVDSRDPGFAAGELVYGDTGWQDYAVLAGRTLMKAGTADPLSHLLSVYGVAGLTAYFGLLECGQPQPGETVVVSAAAGAVGGFVGQIAKLKGCRTIGIAGGAAKCARLTAEFGYDAAIDYKAVGADPRSMYGALKEVCPDGIDVYFDNVGGPIMDACVYSMRRHGRIACCGAVSIYEGQPYGMTGVPGAVVSSRLTLRGFIVSDFYARREAALAELKGWVECGQIRVVEDVLDGLEALPGALVGLLAGENVGKRMVKIA